MYTDTHTHVHTHTPQACIHHTLTLNATAFLMTSHQNCPTCKKRLQYAEKKWYLGFLALYGFRAQWPEALTNLRLSFQFKVSFPNRSGETKVAPNGLSLQETGETMQMQKNIH